MSNSSIVFQFSNSFPQALSFPPWVSIAQASVTCYVPLSKMCWRYDVHGLIPPPQRPSPPLIGPCLASDWLTIVSGIPPSTLLHVTLFRFSFSCSFFFSFHRNFEVWPPSTPFLGIQINWQFIDWEALSGRLHIHKGTHMLIYDGAVEKPLGSTY